MNKQFYPFYPSNDYVNSTLFEFTLPQGMETGVEPVLDDGVFREVLAMIQSSGEFSQEIQDEIFKDMSTFGVLPEISVYLLSIIHSCDVDDVSKCVAAILMNHFFALERNRNSSTFRENAYPVLSPYFFHPPSPLVNSLSFLFAKVLSIYGVELFPDLNDVLTVLLTSSENSQSGLSLIRELLFYQIKIPESALSLLIDHLNTENTSTVMSIISIASYYDPIMCKPLLFDIVSSKLYIDWDRSPIISLIESITYIQFSEFDESFNEFLVDCILSDDEDISTNAASFFQYFSMPFFYSEATNALIQRIHENKSMNIYNLSVQCSESLSRIAHEYPDDVYNIISNLISNESTQSNSNEISRVLRSIGATSFLFNDIDRILNFVTENLSKEPKESLYCLAQISKDHPTLCYSILESITVFLNHDTISIRFQALISFKSVLQNPIIANISLIETFCSLFNTLSKWECILICDAVSNFLQYSIDICDCPQMEVLVECICSKFLTFDETNIEFFGFLKILCLLPSRTANYLNMINGMVSDRMTDIVSNFDDYEQASAALLYFSSVCQAQYIANSNIAMGSIEHSVQYLPNALSSDSITLRTSGWKYLCSLYLYCPPYFAQFQDYITDIVLSDNDLSQNNEVKDLISEFLLEVLSKTPSLFSEASAISLLKNFKEFFVYYGSIIGVTCLLKLLSSFKSIDDNPQETFSMINPILEQVEGTDFMYQCEEYLCEYLEGNEKASLAYNESCINKC